MKLITRSFGFIGIGFVLAACASASGQDNSGTDTDQALESDQALEIEYGNRTHMLPLHASTVSTDSAEAEVKPEAASTAHLTYYGGPVMPSAKIIAVYWGSSVAHQQHLNDFYTSITKSAYFDWLKEYNTSSQKIGRGSFGGAVVIHPSTSAKKITDATIQKEIAKQIKAGHLPAADGVNNLYMLHFPPGMSISQGGSTSCVQFCAYHGTFKQAGKYVFYGVVPDLDHDGCQNGCGNGTPDDNVTEVASHEMIEAVTDPGVGLATANASPLAWYDNANGEIGDICVGKAGKVGAFTVQLEWSNKRAACIAK